VNAGGEKVLLQPGAAQRSFAAPVLAGAVA